MIRKYFLTCLNDLLREIVIEVGDIVRVKEDYVLHFMSFSDFRNKIGLVIKSSYDDLDTIETVLDVLIDGEVASFYYEELEKIN